MDFTNRGSQPTQPNTSRFAPVNNSDKAESKNEDRKDKTKRTSSNSPWVRAWLFFFLICTVILIVALLLLIGFTDRDNADKYVNTDDYQVVQVAASSQDTYYFGKISHIGGNYLVLDNPYTLTDNSNHAATVGVTTLSCAEVSKSDQLVLNESRVAYWANLANDSDVTQAINLFNSTYQNGQCPTDNATKTNEKAPATKPSSTSDQKSSTSTTTKSTAPTTSPSPSTTPTSGTTANNGGPARP